MTFRNPYKDTAASAKEAARFIFEAIRSSKVVVVDETNRMDPTKDTYVAKVGVVAPCKGCSEPSELRFGWCGACVGPHMDKLKNSTQS